MPPYDGRLSGRAVCPLRRGVASSEAEMSYLLEGGSLPSSEAEIVTRAREGCKWATCWASFESFPFFQIVRRSWAFVGPIA